ITELSCTAALQRAKTLETEGHIQQRENYCYLKIDDNYIHLIHPLLAAFGPINKPAYFTPPEDVGAHISIIYPEEKMKLLPHNVGQKHTFLIDGLIKAKYGVKEYFALSVISPSLTAFRQAHHLRPKPTFKDQEIIFHITLGVR
ncbi:MAG: hypothetical protein K2X39_10055, partial [Silvanigrellaceae bacterium]|nr:hypothetical protein [Silvanigrellaceae bacterium]